MVSSKEHRVICFFIIREEWSSSWRNGRCYWHPYFGIKLQTSINSEWRLESRRDHDLPSFKGYEGKWFTHEFLWLDKPWKSQSLDCSFERQQVCCSRSLEWWTTYLVHFIRFFIMWDIMSSDISWTKFITIRWRSFGWSDDYKWFACLVGGDFYFEDFSSGVCQEPFDYLFRWTTHSKERSIQGQGRCHLLFLVQE